MVLLQDIYLRVPITPEDVVPDHDVFPGPTGRDVEFCRYRMTLEIHDTMWISTGLWLPAGAQGTIECGGPLQDVAIQIGCHCEPPAQSGPWHRWPFVLSIYQLDRDVETVSTPFGGIVYVTPMMMEGQPVREIPFTFRNFCKYPRYVHGRPEIWAETRDIEVPWGEIDLGNLIFTLPSRDIRNVMDFQALKDAYDHFTKTIATVLCYQATHPYRIVFDVEETTPTAAEYPATFSIETIPEIVLTLTEPTLALFNAMVALSRLSLRMDCFHPSVEAALAALAASLALVQHYPAFDPITSKFPLPPLFKQFWEVESQSHGVFSKALAKFQGPEYEPMDAPDDAWVELVKELCCCGKCNFTKLLEQWKPIPLNISLSLQGLPMAS
jgi:hypothetical protein